MKKSFYLLLLITLYSSISFAQSLKSISILGDSYSTFEGYLQPDTNSIWYYVSPRQQTDVTSVKQTWWHKFIKENNYRLCVNNSFSGATICNTGYNQADYSDRSFITRMDKLGCPDIIFIFGATNDCWAGSPLGDYKYEGWTKEDLYTFRPAMAYLLDHMIDRYPNVEIYFLLNSGLKEEFNESVRAICNHYNIDCIELHDIDKKSGHPSIKGMEQISEQDVTSVKQTWWHKFIKENNYRLCVNNSFSGATICNTGYNQADYSDRSFITRMDKLGCPDIIFIFGATNDCWAGSPLGDYKYEGWTKEDLYTFRPAMAYLLDHMIDRYPNVEIYFLLNSGLKEEFNESVRAICNHYNIDCIELHDIDKKSGHPSIKGMEQISEQIKMFMRKTK